MVKKSVFELNFDLVENSTIWVDLTISMNIRLFRLNLTLFYLTLLYFSVEIECITCFAEN